MSVTPTAAAQPGMWSRPLNNSSLRQASTATRACCKQLLCARPPPHLHAQPQQQWQQHAHPAASCLALPPSWHLLHQQEHTQQQLRGPLAPSQLVQQRQQQALAYGASVLLQCQRRSITSSASSTAAAAAAPAEPAVAAAGAAGQQGSSNTGSNSGGSSSSSKQAPVKGGSIQTLDYTTLVACCHELEAEWVPSKVEEVVQPDKFTLSLRLRTPLAQGWLHLSWHPTAARLCMGRPPPRGDVSEGFALAQQVSSQLKGLVLLSVGLPAAWERVAQLDFGSRPGEQPSRRLYCEVMAKYSNVVLTGADGSILHCAYQVGGAMSSLRQVQAGRPYSLPPRAQGIPPDPSEPLSSWQDNITRAAALAAAAAAHSAHAAPPDSAAPPAGAEAGAVRERKTVQPKPLTLLSGATRAYLGVSPALVEELCSAAGVLPSAEPSSLNPEAWQVLYEAWQGWLGRLQARQFTPCSSSSSSSGGSRRFSVLGSYPQAHPSVHELLDGYYAALQAGEVYGGLHARLSGAVSGAVKKARGRVFSFQKQLAGAGDAARVQRQGDIIVANLYRIPPGAEVLEAEDWDTGEALLLPLEPTGLTPMEVAEGLFKRARKLRRAVDAVQPLLEAAQQELDYLESVEQELSQMPPGGSEQELAALRQVQEELIESKVIKPPPEAALLAKAAAKGRKAAKRSQKAAAAAAGGSAAAAAAAVGGAAPRQYESPGGFVVLVGRNNKQNDVLSHQIAKPGDVWMHVRGMPGSHTVIRVSPGQQPEQQDLQFAADLAAWFSKGREAGKVDVLVARAEHLKKFKGAKPGQVLVSKEEGNIVARPAESVAAAAAAGGD